MFLLLDTSDSLSVSRIVVDMSDALLFQSICEMMLYASSKKQDPGISSSSVVLVLVALNEGGWQEGVRKARPL